MTQWEKVNLTWFHSMRTGWFRLKMIDQWAAARPLLKDWWTRRPVTLAPIASWTLASKQPRFVTYLAKAFWKLTIWVLPLLKSIMVKSQIQICLAEKWSHLTSFRWVEFLSLERTGLTTSFLMKKCRIPSWHLRSYVMYSCSNAFILLPSLMNLYCTRGPLLITEIMHRLMRVAKTRSVWQTCSLSCQTSKLE